MKEMKYGLAAGCAVVFCLLVGVGSARGDVACPPTDTGVPPTEQPPATETAIPPTDEPTPSSPPEETLPPKMPDDTPTVQPPGETPAPDPTATETPRAHGHAPLRTPTVVETLPVTGGGSVGSWQLSIVGGVVLLGIAFLARMVRRAAK